LVITPVKGVALDAEVAVLHENLKDVLLYNGFTIDQDQIEIVADHDDGSILLKVGGAAFSRLTRRSNGTLTGWLGVRVDSQSRALEAEIPDLNLVREGQFALDTKTCLKEVLRTSVAAQRIRAMHGNRNPAYMDHGLQERHRVDSEIIKPHAGAASVLTKAASACGSERTQSQHLRRRPG
jgi:hypothetical protein